MLGIFSVIPRTSATFTVTPPIQNIVLDYVTELDTLHEKNKTPVVSARSPLRGKEDRGYPYSLRNYVISLITGFAFGVDRLLNSALTESN